MAGSVWLNRGTFEARNDAQIVMGMWGLPVMLFRNEGTFRKTAGVGATTSSALNSAVTFDNAGLLDIRSGTLQIHGGYQAGVGAPVAIELRGPAPGVEHGRLARSGTLPLTGPLTVTLASGYTPAPGTVFTLANFAAREGEFTPPQPAAAARAVAVGGELPAGQPRIAGPGGCAVAALQPARVVVQWGVPGGLARLKRRGGGHRSHDRFRGVAARGDQRRLHRESPLRRSACWRGSDPLLPGQGVAVSAARRGAQIRG